MPRRQARRSPKKGLQKPPPKDLVAFFHVPRTAGTSFQRYADKIVSKDRMLLMYAKLIPQAQEVLGGVRDWEQWRLVRGHITTSWLGLLPEHAKLVTFIRDPVERINSLYKYIRKDPGHPICHEVRQMSLTAFIRSGVTLEVDNGQVRQLCGTEPELLQCAYDPEVHSPPHTPIGEMGWGKLVEAMDVLDRFTVVGTTECMDETYKVLWEATDWERREIPKANSTPATALTLEEQNLILEYNQLDYELWTWATEGLKGELQWF